MENVVRTVYGSKLQTAQYGKSSFTADENSTLNEKFSIQSGIAPTGIPAVGYYAIGLGGHKTTVGSDSIPLVKTVEHLATDAALYKHLPFVLRTTDNDLTTTERAKYALRKTVTIDSIQYYAYYLKRLDLTAAVPTIKLQTTNNGVTSTSTFVPTADNLSPTAPDLTSSGSNELTSQYAIVSATVDLVLTQAEVEEIINAATIIYGDSAYAVISEIALCSGEDKSITLSNGDLFTEAVCVQVCSHISTFHMLAATSTGVDGTLQIGSAEPLLVLSA